MQAEHREEAKEGLERDVLENREALGLVPAGQEDEGEEGQQEEEVVPPQVLKERIESVIEVLSEFQVRRCVSWHSPSLSVQFEQRHTIGTTMSCCHNSIRYVFVGSSRGLQSPALVSLER